MQETPLPAPPPLALCNNGALLLLQAQTSFWVPWALAFRSLAHGTLFLSPFFNFFKLGHWVIDFRPFVMGFIVSPPKF